MAYGYIAVNREGGDGQHRRVSGHFGHEGLYDAEPATEVKRIGLPDGRHLLGESCGPGREKNKDGKVSGKVILGVYIF